MSLLLEIPIFLGFFAPPGFFFSVFFGCPSCWEKVSIFFGFFCPSWIFFFSFFWVPLLDFFFSFFWVPLLDFFFQFFFGCPSCWVEGPIFLVYILAEEDAGRVNPTLPLNTYKFRHLLLGLFINAADDPTKKCAADLRSITPLPGKRSQRKITSKKKCSGNVYEVEKWCGENFTSEKKCSENGEWTLTHDPSRELTPRMGMIQQGVDTQAVIPAGVDTQSSHPSSHHPSRS